MSKGNESAFPMYTFQQSSDGPGVGISEGGLTKRELFAAMAMQGLMSTLTIGREEYTPLMAAQAVSCADALLEALAKEQAK